MFLSSRGIDNWFRALNELGTTTAYDPDEGLAAGGYFLASNIDPSNQTRSDARRTYYDPFITRKNYNVLSNAQVTRLLFHDSNEILPFRKARQVEKRQQNANAPLRATGVEASQSLR